METHRPKERFRLPVWVLSFGTGLSSAGTGYRPVPSARSQKFGLVNPEASRYDPANWSGIYSIQTSFAGYLLNL